MPKSPHPTKHQAEVMCMELAEQGAGDPSEDDHHCHQHYQAVEAEDSAAAADHISWREQWRQQQLQDGNRMQAEPPAPVPLPPFSVALSELMLCVGDWPSPRPGSVAVLEPVLAREVTALVRRAADGPAVRRGRPLDAIHLLWATRRDALMTGRIIQFLELRSITAAVSADSGEPNPERSEQMALLARCRQFCAEIGSPPPPEEDPEAVARRARLDRLTRVMSASQYQAFTSVRATGAQRHKVCRAWVESRWPEGVPPAGAAAWHVLLFLIKELVALLVDACLLVRADGSPEQAGLPTESVTLEHAREAVRRLQMAAPPRADMLLVR